MLGTSCYSGAVWNNPLDMISDGSRVLKSFIPFIFSVLFLPGVILLFELFDLSGLFRDFIGFYD